MSNNNNEQSILEKGKNNKGTKRKWGTQEDAILVSCLIDLVNSSGWKANNGTFRAGYLQQLEKMIETKLPGCGLRAQPHIESRVKILKRQYFALVEMLGPSVCGFGWNDRDKCIVCDNQIFAEWVKSHPNARGMKNKQFPYFEELGVVFQKDRATGATAEAPAVIVEAIALEEQNNLHNLSPSEPLAEGPLSLEEIQSTGQNQTQETSSTPNLEARTNRNKRSRIDSLEFVKVLSTGLSKIGAAMEKVGEQMIRIADSFKCESDAVERRMKVCTELMKVPDLRQEQVFQVGRRIALDSMETDFFFQLA